MMGLRDTAKSLFGKQKIILEKKMHEITPKTTLQKQNNIHTSMAHQACNPQRKEKFMVVQPQLP